jgi:transcriptional regulator GlxA family with amidase domain
MDSKPVLIIAPPRATLQDVTGPWEVFCRAAAYAPGVYEVFIVAAEADLQVRTKYGLEILCSHTVADFAGKLDTVLVAGSEQGEQGQADPGFLAWLRDAAPRTRRMGSVCTGAFYLAHAGLLSGRRATTHWRYLEQLAAEFPEVGVEPDPIFVRDGPVYTSAGITAGIDLALAMVEDDLGPRLSRAIARDMVVFLQRHEDQPQLSTALTLRLADRDPIRQLQRWAPDNLHLLSSVDDMAAHAHMSPRTFARAFKQQTGITPGAWLRQIRAEAARRRMHETDGKAENIAAQVGFGSARTLQRSLRSAPQNARKH